jgi:DNA-binding MurR/RpiR family transcriptional regulator
MPTARRVGGDGQARAHGPLLDRGTSYHIASFLEDGLALYLDADVVFPAARGDPQRAVRHLLSARPDDLMVAISTPRYMRSTLDLCRVAKKHGATLLALTDAPTSPLTPIADITLFAPARNALLPNSPTAVFALADALVTAVASARPEAVEALKELSESRLWNYHP